MAREAHKAGEIITEAGPMPIRLADSSSGGRAHKKMGEVEYYTYESKTPLRAHAFAINTGLKLVPGSSQWLHHLRKWGNRYS